MSNKKFYTIFTILNILLTLYIVICVFGAGVLMFYDLFSTPNKVFLCGLIFYIIGMGLKLLLPKIFINWADKYKESLINKFIEFIHNNPQQKKFILPLAFCFDLPWLIWKAIDIYEVSGVFWIVPAFFIGYGGGTLFFYIALYKALKKGTSTVPVI